MSSKVATARPLFATATSTFCRMSELRQLPLPATDDTSSSSSSINEAATMAMASSTTTTAAAMSHIRSGAIVTATARAAPTVADVKRKLFGPEKPEEHEENIRFVQQELRQISNDDMIKWNYNFQEDKPLEGKYRWEETSASQVPLAYSMTHLCSSSSSSSSTARSLPVSMASTKPSLPTHSINNINPGPVKTSSRALMVKVPSSVKACRNLSFSNTNTSKTNINNNNSTDLNSRINFIKVSSTTTGTNNCTTNNTITTNNVTPCKKDDDIDIPVSICPSLQRQRPQDKTSTARQPSISDFLPQRKRRSSVGGCCSTTSSSGTGVTTLLLDDGYSSEEPSAKRARTEQQPE